jgi:chorismate synthase
LIRSDFPTLTEADAMEMREVIAKARAEGESVGGRIECAITGLPAGIGEPMFGGVESRISQIVYGIPAVKAIGFGWSESFAMVPGSESNDCYYIEDGKIKTQTNHCGGILGGITNGMPVIFDVAIKPTPSIVKPQQSVCLTRMEVQELVVQGRHDPCIVPRAVPVVEAAAAIAIFDLILGNTQTNRRK